MLVSPSLLWSTQVSSAGRIVFNTLTYCNATPLQKYAGLYALTAVLICSFSSQKGSVRSKILRNTSVLAQINVENGLQFFKFSTSIHS
jgi:hypothetical protein